MASLLTIDVMNLLVSALDACQIGCQMPCAGEAPL
jgi:hypothetical protein